MTVYIRIQPGNLGTQMFRYMLAYGIADKIPHARIVGQQMPEWRMSSPAEIPTWRNPRLVSLGDRADVNNAVTQIHAGHADGLEIHDFSPQLEYFAHDLDRFRQVFYSDLPGTPIADDEIAIHVRAGDILEGERPDQFPLPLSFYSHLLMKTGLRPVFLGQLEDSWYSDALRGAFAQAKFLCHDTPCEDFQTLRHAHHKVVAVSSFSWLAAWLSPPDSLIHYPLAGMLNPQQTARIDLMPRHDGRYRFYRFPLCRYTGTAEEKQALLSPQSKFGDYSQALPTPHGDGDIQTYRHTG